MAKETSASLFIGVDHQFRFTILNEAEDAAVDILGWSLSWMIKRNVSHVDAAALLTKTTSGGIVVSGVYDADPAVNTQVATVTIADVDTDPLTAGERVYELKRMDAGAETVLAYGELELLRGVHRT